MNLPSSCFLEVLRVPKCSRQIINFKTTFCFLFCFRFSSCQYIFWSGFFFFAEKSHEPFFFFYFSTSVCINVTIFAKTGLKKKKERNAIVRPNLNLIRNQMARSGKDKKTWPVSWESSERVLMGKIFQILPEACST